MRLLEAKEINLERSDLEHFHPHYNDEKYITPPGTIGVGTLIRSLAIKMHKFTVEDAANEDRPLRMLVGMGWEWGCAALYPDMTWQPGAFQFEGISGHPDGISADNIKLGGPMYWVEEFKYTWKSIRLKGGKDTDLRNILDEWMYIQQVIGYINILNRGYGYEISLGRFHVCWGRGNYEWDAKERYVRYVVEFSEEDLNNNWTMLQNHKREILI